MHRVLCRKSCDVLQTVMFQTMQRCIKQEKWFEIFVNKALYIIGIWSTKQLNHEGKRVKTPNLIQLDHSLLV